MKSLQDLVRTMQARLLPGIKYQAFVFVKIDSLGEIVKEFSEEGFTSFVFEVSHSPMMIAMAIEIKDGQKGWIFKRVLDNLSSRGLVDIELGIDPEFRKAFTG